jgi:hypothetical protein
VLDRDHAVEQIAQQAKLNATDATDRIPRLWKEA